MVCFFRKVFFVCVLRALFHFSFTSLRDLQGGWTLLGYLTRVGVAASPQVGANWSRVRIPKGFTEQEGSESVLEECESIEDEYVFTLHRRSIGVGSMVIKVVISIYDRSYYRVVSSDKVFQRGAPSFFLSVSFRPEGGV